MKLTITAASRREEILQRKADYEAREARNKQIHDEQYSRYEKAQQSVFSGVADEIRRQLGDKIGELKVDVERRYCGLSVEIGNDRGGPRRTPNASLTWSWKATLDKDGEIKKESSSWSGLEAVTMEQVTDLKMCVEQLEIINSMDWKQLLDVSLPRWEDYITNEGIEDLGPKPNFDQELLDADLESAIGNNIAIKGHEGRSFRGEVWFRILRDSGSQYTVEEVPGYAVDQLMGNGSVRYGNHDITTLAQLFEEYGSSVRIRKTNFANMIYKPLQTIPFNA